MKKHFYTHIIEVDSIYFALDNIGLEGGEKKELLHLVERNIHHVVVDTVLSELSEKDKKLFLSHMVTEKHDDLWKLLKEKIENVEEKIRHAVYRLKTELHSDIYEAKRK